MLTQIMEGIKRKFFTPACSTALIFFGKRKMMVGASLFIAIGGCSLSPIIKDDSVDYNDAIADVTNTSLVTNVLRARDSAPMYFPDISIVRGSVTASAQSQITFPFSTRLSSTTRDSAQVGPVTLSTNPTFDIAPTNTKQFYQGILNPISENLLAYFLERYRGNGLGAYIFYLLIETIEESTDRGPYLPYTYRDPEFVRIVDSWFPDPNGVVGPRVVPLSLKSTLLGPPVKADADSIIKAVAAGLEVKSKGDKIQLSNRKSGIGICVPEGNGYNSITIIRNSDVKTPGGEEPYNTDDAKLHDVACNPSGRVISGKHFIVHIRSVEQIFLFLGSLIRADNKFAIRTGKYMNGCRLLPFYVYSRQIDHERFSINYRGQPYFVADTNNFDDCQRRDYTLPILAIVNDLLNLSRDANEIPVTKAVETVGSK